MRSYSVLALTLLAWLAPVDDADAGACDDLNAKVCAKAKDAAACADFVSGQLKGSNGERLSGMPRLVACRTRYQAHIRLSAPGHAGRGLVCPVRAGNVAHW